MTLGIHAQPRKVEKIAADAPLSLASGFAFFRGIRTVVMEWYAARHLSRCLGNRST